MCTTMHYENFSIWYLDIFYYMNIWTMTAHSAVWQSVRWRWQTGTVNCSGHYYCDKTISHCWIHTGVNLNVFVLHHNIRSIKTLIMILFYEIRFVQVQVLVRVINCSIFFVCYIIFINLRNFSMFQALSGCFRFLFRSRISNGEFY